MWFHYTHFNIFTLSLSFSLVAVVRARGCQKVDIILHKFYVRENAADGSEATTVLRHYTIQLESAERPPLSLSMPRR
jgi:hypothetical protein